jgi:hypothetical protein
MNWTRACWFWRTGLTKKSKPYLLLHDTRGSLALGNDYNTSIRHDDDPALDQGAGGLGWAGRGIFVVMLTRHWVIVEHVFFSFSSSSAFVYSGCRRMVRIVLKLLPLYGAQRSGDQVCLEPFNPRLGSQSHTSAAPSRQCIVVILL